MQSLSLSCLRLTVLPAPFPHCLGSVEGIKAQVTEYIRTFDRYDFLWKEDLQAAYDHFMQTNPTLEAFEAELKKYMAIETEVGRAGH